MNFRSVVIVTYGRSGSTLLQGVLNSIPGCLVRGENYNLCLGLYDSYSAYLRTQVEKKFEPSTESPVSPWYGANHLDAERYLADLRAVVQSHLSLGIPEGERPQCIGFKEIRYLANEMPSRGTTPYAEYLHGYLDFLTQLLPGLAIVFLTRAHAQVIKSAWWKATPPAKVVEQLTEFENAARGYAIRRGHCHFIDYGDVVANGPALASLFDFLGAAYDAGRVAEVLGQPHSYDTSPDTASVPVMTSLKLQLHDQPAGVSLVRIDPLPSELMQGRRFHLGGVVVMPDDGTRELGLRDGQGNVMPVKWGLPSPVVGTELPDLPCARSARFRCAEVPVTPGMSYHLVLLEPGQGIEHRLATLSLQPAGAR
jgi:hypothetical protein